MRDCSHGSMNSALPHVGSGLALTPIRKAGMVLANTTTTLCKKGTLNPYSWRPAHTLDSFIVVPSSKRIQVKLPRI